ncbi:hypothetical protein AAG906_039046 [Vitis piasezkii]
MPSQFWGDSILTTTYLINRMPSRALSFVTPLQKFQEFFPHSRCGAHLPLHVFGSTVFVHAHTSKRNKLDPKALKCVFLGYFSTQKGYKCYDPISQKLYVTDDLPIALRKQPRSCTFHPISKFVSYNALSAKCRAFTTNLDRIQIPKNIEEALEIPEWKEAVMEDTWEVMTLPRGKKPMSCKWVFTVKYKADGTVERYKAHLVAKGFTQTYGIDYTETFAPVAKLNTIRVLLSLAANLDWSLHQFDIKNAFLNGELKEEVFMTLPPGFCKEKEETRSNDGRMIILIVYVDDIILTGDNTGEVERLKKVLATKFEVKDLGQMRYFLGMEVAKLRKGISISQRKYVLDLLGETGMLGCKPSDTPIKARKRKENDGKPVDRERYQRLVGRLIYLSHTKPNIAFVVSVVSQYMHSPKESHLEAVYKILRYLKGSPRKGLFFKKGDSKKVEIYTDAD